MAVYYPSEDLHLNIARGLVKGTSFIHKFGAVPAMSQSTTGTVWDVNDTIYPWSSWDTAGTVTVETTSSSDIGKHVTLVGLDANFDQVSETIMIAALTGNAGTTSFKRIFRAYIVNGSTNNVGVVSVKKSGVTVAAIQATKAQTLMAVYTVPAGYTGYLLHGVCTAQAGADATGDMFIRYFGNQAFRVGHSFEVSGTGGQYDYKFGIPIPVPEKSDIDVRIATRSNNGRYTAAFDMILVKNGLS